MIEREVIVVGGGPGGSTAAWQLRRSGVEVLVLDREPFPRTKLCAGWVTPEALADLELRPDDYPHRFLTFERLRVSFKGLRTAPAAVQHSIRRYEFDQFLLERSQAEHRVHAVRSVHRDGEGFVLDERFRCRHLVGAGGSGCPVYRHLFRDAGLHDRHLQAVTLELEYPCAWRDGDCHLWFLEHGLPGYAWYVPKADGWLNIGVGAMARRLGRRRDDIRDHWDRLVHTLHREGLIDEDPGPPSGHAYYLRRGGAAPRRGNVLLVGDAAGLATRDLCEGIGPAIRSGLRAADAILHEAPYRLDDVARHSLPNPVLAGLLDLCFTGARGRRRDIPAPAPAHREPVTP